MFLMSEMPLYGRGRRAPHRQHDQAHHRGKRKKVPGSVKGGGCFLCARYPCSRVGGVHLAVERDTLAANTINLTIDE